MCHEYIRACALRDIISHATPASAQSSDCAVVPVWRIEAIRPTSIWTYAGNEREAARRTIEQLQAKIKSAAEQIDRLTAERDRAQEQACVIAEGEARALRAGAEQACSLLKKAQVERDRAQEQAREQARLAVTAAFELDKARSERDAANAEADALWNACERLSDERDTLRAARGRACTERDTAVSQAKAAERACTEALEEKKRAWRAYRQLWCETHRVSDEPAWRHPGYVPAENVVQCSIPLSEPAVANDSKTSASPTRPRRGSMRTAGARSDFGWAGLAPAPCSAP